MTDKKLNTAQELFAHIGLKTEPLPLFGAMILVKQWTASERIKYMAIIMDAQGNLSDEIAMIRPQATVVALSMVNDKGKPLFAVEWENDKPVFSDADCVETLVQCGGEEASKAFVEISKFNGVDFSDAANDVDAEEQATKN